MFRYLLSVQLHVMCSLCFRVLTDRRMPLVLHCLQVTVLTASGEWKLHSLLLATRSEFFYRYIPTLAAESWNGYLKCVWQDSYLVLAAAMQHSRLSSAVAESAPGCSAPQFLCVKLSRSQLLGIICCNHSCSPVECVAVIAAICVGR
jgi:hypothetical protein